MTNYIKKIKQFFVSKYNNFLDDRLIKKHLSTFPIADHPYVLPLLRNQLNTLNTGAYSITTQQTKKQKLLLMSVAAAVCRRILTLRGFVGVQPMQGPVGLVYSMQQSKETSNDGIDHWKLCINSHTTEARSRMLNAGWTIEVVQDLKSQHGMDIEAELMKALASEISYELISEVINDLVNISDHSTCTFTQTDTSLTLNDKITQLMCHINRESSAIAQNTRRGAGNVIITTPIVVSLFQSMKIPGFRFESTSNSNWNISGLIHTGNIVLSDDRVKYAVYSTVSSAISGIGKDNILIAYKGKPGETDTGYIYSPYVPVLSKGISVDPVTFTPVVQFMTRYGKWTDDTTGLHSSSKNYYRTIEVDSSALYLDNPESPTPQ